VIASVVQKILRDIDCCRIKRDILKLDEQLLSLGIEKCQIVLNGGEIILLLLFFQLTPGVFQLRSFKRPRFQKSGLENSLPVSVEEYVMMWVCAARDCAECETQDRVPREFESGIHIQNSRFDFSVPASAGTRTITERALLTT
jgi:hypothetical protein